MIQKMSKITQYQRVFNQFDENQDGKISPTELQQCVSSSTIGFGDNFTLQQAESAIELLDSDGDGLISFDDFVKFIEGGEEEEKIKVLKETFQMYYDDDRSGKYGSEEISGGAKSAYVITAKSLKRRLSKLGVKKSDEQCLMMIAQFDLNGDGVLNFDEFLVMMS